MHRYCVVLIGYSIERTNIIGLSADATEKKNADDGKDEYLCLKHRLGF